MKQHVPQTEWLLSIFPVTQRYRRIVRPLPSIFPITQRYRTPSSTKRNLWRKQWFLVCPHTRRLWGINPLTNRLENNRRIVKPSCICKWHICNWCTRVCYLKKIWHWSCCADQPPWMFKIYHERFFLKLSRSIPIPICKVLSKWFIILLMFLFAVLRIIIYLMILIGKKSCNTIMRHCKWLLIYFTNICWFLYGCLLVTMFIFNNILICVTNTVKEPMNSWHLLCTYSNWL